MSIRSSLYCSSDYHWLKKLGSYGATAGLAYSALHNDSTMVALDLFFLLGQRINATTLKPRRCHRCRWQRFIPVYLLVRWWSCSWWSITGIEAVAATCWWRAWKATLGPRRRPIVGSKSWQASTPRGRSRWETVALQLGVHGLKRLGGRLFVSISVSP